MILRIEDMTAFVQYIVKYALFTILTQYVFTYIIICTSPRQCFFLKKERKRKKNYYRGESDENRK